MNEFLTKQLCAIGGAKLSVLALCPTEINRFKILGLTILCTATMAGFSGGIAHAVTTNSLGDFRFSTIVVGIIWGIFIMTFDRFMVTYMKNTGDFVQDLRSAWPRILLAIILGYTLAQPLELIIFQKEVEIELQSLIMQEKRGEEDKILQQINQQLLKLDSQVTRLQNEIDFAYSNFQDLRSASLEEYEGLAHSKKSGAGPIYQQKKEAADQAEQVWRNTKERNEPILKQNRAEILLLTDRKRQEVNDLSILNRYDGFAAKLRALGALTQKDWHAWSAKWMITLLIIIIELLPVLTKLMSPPGLYEKVLVLENERLLHKAQIRKEKSDHQVQSWLNTPSAFSQLSEHYQSDFAVNVKQLDNDEADGTSTSLPEDAAHSPPPGQEVVTDEAITAPLPFWEAAHLQKIKKNRDQENDESKILKD